MEYQHIIYQPGRIARVILNRPQYLNAQSRLMREEMDDAFRCAIEDDQVAVIVLSGAGDHFSSGHDLGTPEELADRQERGYPSDQWGRYQRMRATTFENSLRWRNLPKPTIAMVHGYCIFGGWIFAASMDLVFASEDALFLPSYLQYFSVPWDIGSRKAKEILFEHRFMTAWEAYQHGLVNRVFPKEKLEEETMTYAEHVVGNWDRNAGHIRTAKFAINHMMDAMGFTEELESAYQNYYLNTMLRENPRTRDDKGIALTDVAKENLEAARPWLESSR